MKEEHHPLVGLRCGDDLPLGWKPVGISFARYPASRSLAMSFSLMEEAIHLPPTPDPDMIGVLFWAEKARAWALELENGWAEEGEGMGERG